MMLLTFTNAYFLGLSSSLSFDIGKVYRVSKNKMPIIQVTYSGCFSISMKEVNGPLNRYKIKVKSMVLTKIEMFKVLYRFFLSAVCANLKKLVSRPYVNSIFRKGITAYTWVYA